MNRSRLSGVNEMRPERFVIPSQVAAAACCNRRGVAERRTLRALRREDGMRDDFATARLGSKRKPATPFGDAGLHSRIKAARSRGGAGRPFPERSKTRRDSSRPAPGVYPTISTRTAGPQSRRRVRPVAVPFPIGPSFGPLRSRDGAWRGGQRLANRPPADPASPRSVRDGEGRCAPVSRRLIAVDPPPLIRETGPTLTRSGRAGISRGLLARQANRPSRFFNAFDG
jgi:hypothetical protein